jgi:2-hydroxy-3-oxopropionate reductase
MVAEAGRAVGVRVLDAPVSGGEQGAIEGTLSVMVGGEAADVEEAWPVLDAMAALSCMSAGRVPARR